MNQKRLKIMFLVHEWRIGGSSKSLITLSKLLMAKGHEVIVVFPFKKCEASEVFEAEGISVTHCFYVWWQIPATFKWYLTVPYRCVYTLNYLAAKRLRKLANKMEIDIIHTNSGVLDVGARIRMKSKIPHVWHFREYGKDDFDLRYLIPKETAMKIVNDFSDKQIFISNDIYNYYTMDINKDKSVMIYNGIEKGFLNNKSAEKRKMQKVNFLISGSIQKNKGQYLAIEAAKKLLDEEIVDFKVNIAGRKTKGNAKHLEYLEQLISTYKLEEFVVFSGFISDMSAFRKNMDVELVCSNREAFGRVTIEAMMSGNPVIATNTGANPELICEGKTGYIFENENSIELARCMKWCIKNPEIIFEMGKNAFLYARENFTAEKNADKIEEIYYELIQKAEVI